MDDTWATTLLVTHDLDEALKLADRVLLLSGGVVVDDLHLNQTRPRDRVSLEPLRQRLERQLH